MSSVSSTTLIVSTSSASLVRQAMSPRRAPEATEAGYSLAKLRSPKMAARRSSSSVALARRLLSVVIVSVAVCLTGAWASSIRSIVGCWRRSSDHEFMAVRCWWGCFGGSDGRRSYAKLLMQHGEARGMIWYIKAAKCEL
jgi:hypothetical protein